MGGPGQIHLYTEDEAAANAALALARTELERLEAKYSRYREDSLLSRINRASGAVTVDEETAGLLDFAAQAYAHSGGLFDPTSGVLREIWDFRTGRRPEPAELEAVLPRIGWSQLSWSRPRISLPAGMQLDLGGCVKEYAADALAGLLRRQGFAHGLVNLAGDIAVVGPHPDGSAWQVGVQHPRRAGEPIAQIPLAAGALASSGDYERYFEHDGQRYCHILNPRTGWPAQGFAAVSVAAPQCLIAGVACTVGMLLGPPEAERWLDETGLAWLAVTAEGALRGRLRSPI